MVLTDLFTHMKYEYRYKEADILVILEGFQKMMDMRGTGKDGAITISDIESVFKGNEWVLKNWREGGNFEQNLRVFNRRKIYYQFNGQLSFIEQYYPNVIERFFRYSEGDGIYSMLARVPGLGDLSPHDFVDLDLAEIFSDL